MTQLDLCLSVMETEGVDAVLLGREANARAIAGTARLWLAGTRAFAPSCVVVRATGAVHVLAITAPTAIKGSSPSRNKRRRAPRGGD